MEFIENLSPTSSDNEYFFYYNYKPVNMNFNTIFKLVVILYLYCKKRFKK
jgi:hypothetical protein